MATIRIDLVAEGNAQREILRLRSEVNNLGEQIARNTARTAAGTAEERRKTAETNRGLRAQQQLLRAQQNRQAIALAGLRQESGLLANVRRQTELLDRETRNAGGGARIFSRAFGELAGTLGAIGITEVAFGLVSFGRNVVDASVRVEGFRNSLTALYGDAQIADRVLGDLQEAARLPGITFEGAVQGAIRLKTVQIEGDRAQRIITEFGNAAALSGASAEEMNRALVGLTQTVARGQIEQDNLNQVLENVPLIGNAIREAFGSIDAETIREVLESAGNDVNDFVDILTNQLAMGARASADTTTNAFSNLRNSTFELSAAIGDSLTPSVRDAAMFLTGLLDGITGFLEGSQFGTRSAEEFTEAISGTTQSVRELLPELDEYIRRLEQRANNPRGVLSGQELEDLREAKELYDLVSDAVDGNSEALAGLEARTMAAKDALDAANAEQERLKAAIDAVDPSIRSERDSLQGLNADLRANTERVEEAQSEYNDLNRVLTSVTQEADSLKQGISELEAPTTTTRGAIGELETTVASVDTRFLTFRERADTLSGSIRALPPEITAVRTEFDVLAPTAERVNAIFTTYNETLGEYVRVSGIVVTSAQAEQEALDAVTQEIIQQTQDAEGLADTTANLTRRTDAHNAALANPAVSDAVDSLRNYSDIIGDVNLGYDEIIPASQDFVDGLVAQESAFDDLRTAADAAEISLDDIDDTFSRIPDAIDPSIVSMEDFETVALRALRDIGDELSAFEGGLGDVGIAVDNLVTLFANPVNFAAGTLGAVIEGLTTLEDFAGPLGLPEDFFDDPTPGSEVIRGGQSLDDARYQDFVDIVLGRRGGYEDPIQFLLDNAPGLIEEFRPRIDTDPRLSSVYNRLFPQQTGPISSFTRSPDFDVDAEYAATFEDTPEGAPLASQTQATTGSQQPTERISGSDAASSGERGIGDEIDPLVSRAQDRLINSIIRPVFRGVLSAISDHEINLDLSDFREEIDSNVDRISSRLTTNIVRPVIRAMLQEIGDTQNVVDLPSDFENDIGDSIEDISTRIRTSILNPILRSILASIRAQRDNIALPSEVSENISESVDDISNRIFQNVLSPVLREIQSAVRGVRDDVVLSPEIIGHIQDIPNQIAGVIIREIVTPIIRQISSEIRRTDVPAVSSLDFSGITADGSPQTSSITASQPVVRQAMATATEPTSALTGTALSTQQIVGDPEREAREAERQRERQQREAERANEQRIREEMRTQDRINDLRDDAAENEQDRLADLAELAEEHQRRLTDIEEDGIRAREDLQRDASRSREDIEREFQDNYREARRQLIEGDITQEEAVSELQALGRERLTDLRDLDIRTGRREEDIGIREERQTQRVTAQAVLSSEQINEQATANATAIAMQLGEIQAPATQAATTTADATTMTAGHAETIAMATGTTAEGLTQVNENLESLVMLAGAGPTPQSVESMTINAQTVIVYGADVEGGGGGSGGRTLTTQSGDLVLDGQKVGQILGNTILRQGANGRNLLGGRR